jgi:hypothetical protein
VIAYREFAAFPIAIEGSRLMDCAKPIIGGSSSTETSWLMFP